MITRTVFLVILCLGVSHSAAFAQTTGCNDSAIMSLMGKWTALHGPRPPKQLVTNEQYLQIANRTDAAHAWLLEAYPELVGMYAGRWGRAGVRPAAVAPGLLQYTYRAVPSPYFCSPNAAPDSVLGKRGAPFKPVYLVDAIETRLEVHFNHFGDPDFDFLRQEREMTVDRRQVFHRLRPAGAWKGYELYVTRPNLAEKDGLVLLTRKGMLPYRPITRKQYLDYMIATLQRQYDDTVAAAKGVLQNPDTSRVPEFVEGAQRSLADAARIRDDTTARFQEELKKNAADKTLDSPAIVAGIRKIRFIDDLDVFTTEEKGGQALVTVNPDYFRKDLPPYVPQFIVVHWFLQSGVASANFRKLLEANLPIEKLQAMIDR